jgi:hypothetical protein
MFGCVAVYAGEKILLVLREKSEEDPDNGVWLATVREHHESLRQELPSLRSIQVFGSRGETGWQVLPATGAGFEEEAMHACSLILGGDERIGKVPKAKKPKRKPVPKRRQK